jgi:peroxiredoxin
MASARSLAILTAMLIMTTACGSIKDDLNPSSADKRIVSQASTTGPGVGQYAPDFTISDSLGNPVTLSSVLPAYQGTVLYFTMWCPTCDSHMSSMRDAVVPRFPNVRFFVLDYVSGSVPDVRNAQISNGYDNAGFTVLADTDQNVLNLYYGTMGTTVVIDRAGVVLMNEDYKDGSKLQSILEALP